MTDTPPTPTERLLSIVSGVLILFMATLAFVWAGHWAAVWLQNPAGLPGEMAQVLLVAVLGGAVVGVGAWRLLRQGIAGPVLGLTPGGLVLAMLALGVIVGAAV